jgi:hypothetical protein
MPTNELDEVLEQRIAEWRTFLHRRQAIESVDVDELEDHLRNQIFALTETGLDADEAFLVAVKRVGDLDSLSREFALEYSQRLWKQLVHGGAETETRGSTRSEAAVVLGLAIASALAVKVPALFGLGFEEEADVSVYFRNLSLFVLPLLATYFVWKRRVDVVSWRWLPVPFIAAAAVVNTFPFVPQGHTLVLAALHLPIVLWLAVGFAYVGGDWRDHARRMDFVRFSGEWFIYYALIAAGGGVLMGFTGGMFAAIGQDAQGLIVNWVMPCGALGAVIVAAWLVEAKQSVVENMAPVLTRLFTPLFTLLLLGFLGTMFWTGSGIDVERQVLISFDLLLVLVFGLLLYSISARDPQAPPNAFDALQLLLVMTALVVDALALAAIAGRISEFGFSPNKVAALGENLVLLVSLGWSARLYAGFLRGRSSFAALERWQTAYLPVYGIWAALVVVVFPPLFGYV